MSYSADTKLYYVKYPYSEVKHICSKKEIQALFRFNPQLYSEIELQEVITKIGSSISNREIASKNFLIENGLL